MSTTRIDLVGKTNRYESDTITRRCFACSSLLRAHFQPLALSLSRDPWTGSDSFSRYSLKNLNSSIRDRRETRKHLLKARTKLFANLKCSFRIRESRERDITFIRIKERKKDTENDQLRDANGVVSALQSLSEAVYYLKKIARRQSRNYRRDTRSLPHRLQIYKTRLRCYLMHAHARNESRFPRLSEVFIWLVRRTSSRRFPLAGSRVKDEAIETSPERIPRWMISVWPWAIVASRCQL